MKSDFFGLIVAGGVGTRLWPISRGNMPKQLLPLSGSNRSLLQDAFARLARSVSAEQIITVTSKAYEQPLLAQIQELACDYPGINVLAEPIGRDSGPAVLWGALRIHHLHPEAVVAIIWADQMIRNEAAFDEALGQAYGAVANGGMVAIGVPANRPTTTLGYIKYGREVGEGIYEADRFIEKPDRVTAEHLVSEGTYLWNPGIFVFKVSTLLQEYERLAPTVMGHFRDQGSTSSNHDWRDPDMIAAIYAKLPRESIDYLLLEKTDRLQLIPCDLDWSDLGTWDELYFQKDKDENGNVLSGNAVTLHTRNTYIRGGRRLIATVGVEDLVVVDTDDALLICDMKCVQDVKHLVEHLKERNLPEAEAFEEHVRPWGSYTVLSEGPGYKVKVLQIHPRQKLSLQMHNHRAEHWVVVQGRVLLTRDEEVVQCTANDYFYVPQGAKHRIENNGDGEARIIEVQQGTYLGEDDIVRFEDVYGRA